MDTSKLASFPLASCYRYDSLSSGYQVTLTRVLTKKSRNTEPAHRNQRRMFEQTFKNIDDILHKDSGCSSELDYTEQTSWMLFLKYLDDLEQEKSLTAELEDKDYSYIIDLQYQWSAWAAPKDFSGNFDHNRGYLDYTKRTSGAYTFLGSRSSALCHHQI